MLLYNIIQEKEIKEKWLFILNRVSEGKKHKETVSDYHTSLLPESYLSDIISKNTDHHINSNNDINQNDKITDDIRIKNGENENYENYVNNSNKNEEKINENENWEVVHVGEGTESVRDALLRTYGVTLSNDCTGQTISN